MLTGIFKKQNPKFPINPRFRAYGKARLDIARRAASRADWDKLWKEPANAFPFEWGDWWKQCIEYKVDDFAAEVGFFTDILGLPVNAFDPGYAMFTSPAQDFFLAIVPTEEGGRSTPPDSMRIQFMVADIMRTTAELERRGIHFEQRPVPCVKGSSMFIGYFRTPHGICVDLWGVVEGADQSEPGELVEPEEFEQEMRADEVSISEDDFAPRSIAESIDRKPPHRASENPQIVEEAPEESKSERTIQSPFRLKPGSRSRRRGRQRTEIRKQEPSTFIDFGVGARDVAPDELEQGEDFEAGESLEERPLYNLPSKSSPLGSARFDEDAEDQEIEDEVLENEDLEGEDLEDEDLEDEVLEEGDLHEEDGEDDDDEDNEDEAIDEEDEDENLEDDDDAYLFDYVYEDDL